MGLRMLSLKYDLKRISTLTRYGTIFGGLLTLSLMLTYVTLNSSWMTSSNRLLEANGISKRGTPDLPVTTKTRKTRIAFLKIPKSGSSTLACVFLRFGDKNNLTMFLPNTAVINETDQKKLLEERRYFDIFAIHAIYDHHFFTHIVRDPAIIGLIRDPEQRLMSHAFFFWRKLKRFRDLSQRDFVNGIVQHGGYHARNLIANYFRIPYLDGQNSSKLQTRLDELNSEFTLVLILERIDESLVLMKRLLKWSFADIVYKKKKINTNVDYNATLTSEQKKQVRRSNKLDFDIYNFFKNELDKRISAGGKDFQNEVNYFRHVLKRVQKFCEVKPANRKRYSFPPSKWDSRFSISRKDCRYLYHYDMNTYKRGRYTQL